MKIKKLTSRWIHFALLLITGMVLTGSAKAQWVTYWDYLRNAGTATRTATIPTVVGNGTVTVGLTNSATGVTLPGVSVTMTNFSGGVQNGGTSGSAAAGSPAYATFNSFVDFSAGGIEVTTGSVALLINGLDPAKTYSFSGTSIRGNAPYTGRWTRCAITNVVSFTSAHTPGVVTTTVGGTVLGAHEAAYNCGINNTAGTGDMVVWTNIVPNASGQIVVISRIYNNSGPATDTKGYAIAGFRLEEVASVVVTPVAITGGPTPANLFVPELEPAIFTVSVSGSSPHYQWYHGATPVGTDSATLIIPITVPSDTGSYTVVVTNSINSVTSNPVNLTVNADTVKPTLVRALAEKDLTTIRVSYSKPMSSSAAESFNYQIYPTGDPDLGESANALGIISAVVTNGTNVIFTTSARTLGTNYTLLVNDVTDTTSGPNTILTNSSIPLHYIVDLITMLDSAWKYNESGEELGTAWRNVGYDDGATGWSNGVALFEGKRGAIPATLLPIVRTTNDVSLVGANVKVTNFYYRTTFNFPWATNGSSLRVTHYIDDGAVFYLNGEHAYDIGMDLTGSLAATNFANRSVGDAASEGPFSVAMTNLHSGANLMAIEVHQATAGSSDITFAANLEAIIPSFDLAVLAPPPLAIQQVGPDAILSWPGSGFTLQGVGALLNSATPWTNISGATSPYTNSTGGQGFFRLKN